MFCDYHTHTVFSSDSMYPMEDCIKDAISLGIEDPCFTDHVDYGIKDDWDDLRNNKATKKYFNVDYDKYFSDLETLREKYKNQITIKNGLEFGIQKYNIEKYNKLFEKYPLDFIILSVHQIDD